MRGRRAAVCGLLGLAWLPSGPAQAGVAADLTAQASPVYDPFIGGFDGWSTGARLDVGYDFGWVRPGVAGLFAYRDDFVLFELGVQPNLRIYPLHRLKRFAGAYVRAGIDFWWISDTVQSPSLGATLGVGYETPTWHHVYLLGEIQCDQLFGGVAATVPTLSIGGGVRY